MKLGPKKIIMNRAVQAFLRVQSVFQISVFKFFNRAYTSGLKENGPGLYKGGG